jgi:hypothetical protein
MKRAILLWAIIVGATSGRPVARAHDPGLSALTVQQTDSGLSYRLQVDDAALPAGRRGAGCAPRGVIAAWHDGRPLTVHAGCRAGDAQHTVFEGQLEAPADGDLTVELALLEALPRGHRSYLRVIDAGGALVSEQMLARAHGVVQVHVAAGDRAGFFMLGLWHILTGFDHLLFLGVLLLGVHGVRRMAAIVSCFTLAHSLTLALATLHVVALSSALVESLIAASVVFVAVRGCARNQHDGERLLATFGFGLVHGLGFASALEGLGSGGTTLDVIGPLLRFNLGVETGQLLVGIAVLPLVSWLRRCTLPRFEVRRLLAGAAATIGLFWLFERALPH